MKEGKIKCDQDRRTNTRGKCLFELRHLIQRRSYAAVAGVASSIDPTTVGCSEPRKQTESMNMRERRLGRERPRLQPVTPLPPISEHNRHKQIMGSICAHGNTGKKAMWRHLHSVHLSKAIKLSKSTRGGVSVVFITTLTWKNVACGGFIQQA